MTDMKGLKRVFFLGIGGIGMSALARYFHKRGVIISGYDGRDPINPKTCRRRYGYFISR
jgi:UDP-N-acetylmuramate-alanine ligase